MASEVATGSLGTRRIGPTGVLRFGFALACLLISRAPRHCW